MSAVSSNSNKCLYVILPIYKPLKACWSLFTSNEANHGNTLWGKRTVFPHSAITPPKVNRFGRNLEQYESNVGGWPWQILGTICTLQFEKQPRFFSVRYITHNFTDLQSDKFYDIWRTQRRSVRRWKLSEQNFENFTIRGHLSKKTQKLLTKYPGLKTSGRHNSAIITDAENSLPK